MKLSHALACAVACALSILAADPASARGRHHHHVARHRIVIDVARARAEPSAPLSVFVDSARPEAMLAAITKTRAEIDKTHDKPCRHACPDPGPVYEANAPMDIRTPAQLSGVKAMIANAVCARIGCNWTGTALRIAKIESGFNCHARNGRAVGIFQNTDPARFGVSRAAALTCGGGVSAGVSHMAMCINLGAHDAASMMRCHNSGSPHGRVDRVYRLALAGRL